MNRLPTLACSLVCAVVVAGHAGAQGTPGLVVSSDPELRALAERLLPDLALRAGMELREPVRLEMRTREELVRYLRFKLDEELPEAEARDRARVYAYLGLVPDDTDLRELLLGLYTEQVAGFYEPDSTALFVLDDQPPEALEALLVHELVHAIQDQTADLHALTDTERGGDRATAAQAAIEGHATLVMFEYLTEQMTGTPIDLGQIPDFASQVRPALEAMNSQFPALANAPRVVRDGLLFPYVEGAGFVQRLWAGDERRSPFGEALPGSTEQVVWPEAEPPVELTLAVHGGRVLVQDVMGALELNILVEDVLGFPGSEHSYGGAAGAIAAAWDGDRYALVEQPDGSTGLTWYVLWSSEGARDRFVEAVESNQARFGGPVRVEVMTVSGHLASIVHLGGSAHSVTASAAGTKR